MKQRQIIGLHVHCLIICCLVMMIFIINTDGQVCSNFDVADLNNGSMLFFCDDDGLTECCGTPGEQQCCAHTDFKSAYIVSNTATSSVNR